MSFPSSLDVFDLFIMLLRVAFIGLIYLFLLRVARVSVRELEVLSRATAQGAMAQTSLPDPASALELLDPAESSYYVGTSFPLVHYSTVGRTDENSIVIDDSFISAAHAEIVFEHGAWWLHDLNSTNGTRVNRKPVQSRVRLSDGDILEFGRVRLRAHV